MASPDFTVADVLAWARTKPAGERYDFTNSSACAIAQFGLATGRNDLVGLFSGEIPLGLKFDLVGDGGPQTFGDLVGRLEARCPKAPITPSNWSAIDAYMADIEAVTA